MQLKNINFSPPDISEDEINEVVDTLRSGWITTGPKTKLLEKRVAEFCNVKKAVCLNSATACLELILRILGVKEGDQVITSAYTYTASCSVICHVGATPVLVDTANNSFEMDYDALERAITEKTKAIIPIDLAGVMCDYDKIFEIVKRKQNLFNPQNEIQKKINRVAVVADSAHSFGATYHGEMCGSIADFTAVSFHAVKNFTTAEGGCAMWKTINGIDDKNIYDQFMRLSLHGQSKDALAKTEVGNWEYDILVPGFKFNMTDVHASIGLAQLKRYPELLRRRKEIIKMYDEGLSGCAVDCLRHYDENQKSSGHLYLVRVKNANEDLRNKIIKNMSPKGVTTNVHYKPLPMFSAYRELGFDIKNFPNSFSMYENEITLPLHTLLTDDDVNYVLTSFKESLENVMGA